MTQKTNTSPLLPQPPTFVDPNSLGLFLIELWRSLVSELQRLAVRANAMLPADGSEPMTNPLPLQQFTVATLPSPSAWTGAMVYVSNGTSNKRLAISDGTNWRWPDGAIVS